MAVIEVDNDGKNFAQSIERAGMFKAKHLIQINGYTKCRCLIQAGGKTIRTSGDGVIHLRYSSQPESPYIGLSPLYFMQETAGLIYSLDRKFDEEAQTSTDKLFL